ncbi:MAG: hypothetical protein IKA41_01600 [Bacteroidaceae bacterium]|nr:hypothetical protein [Bacteroidaceae bacterium]
MTLIIGDVKDEREQQNEEVRKWAGQLITVTSIPMAASTEGLSAITDWRAGSMKAA